MFWTIVAAILFVISLPYLIATVGLILESIYGLLRRIYVRITYYMSGEFKIHQREEEIAYKVFDDEIKAHAKSKKDF